MCGEESWRECCKWLTRIGLLAPDHRTNLPTATIKDLAYTLRDGVQLCRLLNLIKPGSLDMKEISQRPQMAQFLCLRNIRTFLHVCQVRFLLQEPELFQPDMLFDLNDFGKVLFTLSRLSTCQTTSATGIEGFNALGAGDHAPILDEEMQNNLEELASGVNSSEPSTPMANLAPVTPAMMMASSLLTPSTRSRAKTKDEVIYEELCYITFRTKEEQPVAAAAIVESRDYVKRELLDTEGNYIDALNMVKKKFMKPLNNLLKEEEKKIIFFGFKELSEIHTGFLSDLSRAINFSANNGTVSSSSSTINISSITSLTSGVTPISYPSMCSSHCRTVGDVFLHWKDKFIIYGDYCANLTQAQNFVEELCSKNEVVAAEVLKCERDVKEGKFKLRDLLSVPMQRVLKYHLLLQRMVEQAVKEGQRFEEYASTEKARDAMLDVAQFTNEVKRDNETLQIIRQIEGSIYDLKMPEGMELKDYGRLQKDGELRIRGHDDNRLKTRYVFIFDKVMLMCKPTRMVDKLFGSEQYSYKHSLCLQEYRVEDVAHGTVGGRGRGIREARWTHCWNLVHHKEKNVYTMYAQTEEQKRLWIKAIESALTSIQPEECRQTDHHWTMHTFAKGCSCTQCGMFLKGLFYQGYRCVRCDAGVHRACISELPQCGLVHPPELPPRPPLLLPIHPHRPPSLPPVTSPTGGGGTLDQRSPRRLKTGPSSPPLPLNNLNSPCTSNGMLRGSLSSSSLLPPGGGEGGTNASHHYVNLNHLESYPWYAGEMTRDYATGLLMNAMQQNGSFLVRVRPGAAAVNDAVYALSLRWNEQVKHMKILLSREDLYYLSESRYFKSVVELINWYQHNSLAESFSGLDARLERPFFRLAYGLGVVHLDYQQQGHQRSASISSLPAAVVEAAIPPSPSQQENVPGIGMPT